MKNEKMNETLDRTISVRLTENEMETFQMICNQLNTSKSVFLRGLIQNINTRLEDDLDNDYEDEDLEGE